MKRLYCDFCGIEIEEKYQFVDWSHHNYDLDLCKKCYDKLGKLIKLEMKNGR